MMSILTAVLGVLILPGTYEAPKAGAPNAADQPPFPVRPAVSSGSAHVLLIRDDGTVWGWGANRSGQLADGSRTDSSVPVLISDDDVWVDVSGGRYHSMFLKTDGTLWCAGESQYGQLGNGSGGDALTLIRVGEDSDWAAVSAGGEHTLALKKNSSL